MPQKDPKDGLHRLVYASRAVLRPGREDDAFHEILSESRRRNVAFDITGALLACNGQFLQVLEGPRDRAMQAFARIRRDRRHESIRVIASSQIGDRQFGMRSMCGRRLSPTDDAIVAVLDGHSGLNLHTLMPTSALRLLHSVQKLQVEHATPEFELV